MISLPKSELFRTKLEELSQLALEIHGEYHEYSDEELFNAIFVLMEVFMAKLWDRHRKNLTFPQLEVVGKMAGEKIHNIVEVFTGCDLKDVIDNE